MKKDHYLSRINIIILVIIFSICSIITTLLITNKRAMTSEDSKPGFLEVTDVKDITNNGTKYRVESLDETYNKNNLLISKQKYEPKQENIFKTDDDEFDYFGNCFYPQISGLKNSLIQEKINKELKALTIDTGFYTEFNVNSNFGNTLSITISKLVDKDSFENSYLNYNLTTGKQLALKDLFIKKANLNYILSSSIYNSLAESIANIGLTDATEFSNLHEITAEYLNKYNDGEKIDFYFTSRFVYIVMDNSSEAVKKLNLDNSSLYIDMQKYFDQVAIYKKYLTEKTIFDDSFTETEKNIKVFN